MSRPAMGKSSRQVEKSSAGLTGFLDMFDLSQDHLGRKSLSERRYSDGLEAPRNSLDIPSGIYDFPRHSVARHDETPIAIEFPMVAARKTKSVDTQSKTSGIQDVSEDVEARNRGSNVVARLMGLEALPRQQDAPQPPRKPFEERISQQWQEDKRSQGSKMPPKVQTSAKIILYPEVDGPDEILSTKILPFRDHPQEMQLQEFKKHFRARQALQARERLQLQETSEQPVSNQEKAIFVAKKFANLKQTFSKSDLHKSKEFQDAVEFLHSNKEFFLKFLQEPNSSYGKQHENSAAPEVKRPIKMKQMTKPVAGQIAKEFPEHRREAFGPESSVRQPKIYGESKLAPKKQAGMPMQRPMGAVLDRGAAAPNVDVQNRQEHPISTNTKNNTIDNNPTRIVVLKPNLGKGSQVRGLPTSSSSSRVSASNRDTKGYAEPRKERDRTRQSDLQLRKEEGRISKELSRDRVKVLPKDPRQIAREIARRVRDSVAKETDKPFASNEEMLSARLLDSGRRLNQVKTGTYSNVTESSDREVASAPASRRHVRDCPPTVSSSQPTSPCMSKTLAAAPTITSKEGKFQLMEKLRVFQIRGSEESLKEMRMFSRKLEQMKPSKQPIMQSLAHSRNITQFGKKFVEYPDNLHFDAEICSDRCSIGSRFSKSSVILNSAISSDLYTQAEEESSNLATTFTSPNASSHISSAEDSSEGEAQVNTDYKRNRNRLKSSIERASMESTKDFFRKTALKESSPSRCKPLSVMCLQPSKKILRQFGMPGQHFVPMELTPNVSTQSEFSGTHPASYSRAKNDDMRMTGKHHQSVESSGQNLSTLQQVHAQTLKEANLGVDHQHDSRENISTEGYIHADQLSTKAKLWSLTPEALSKADNTSEITSEKSEQPSPVSVLDSLFEESPPGNLKEVTSEMQELSLRLRFLKLDAQHLSGLEARRSIEAYKLDADSKKDESPCDEAVGNIHIHGSDEKRHRVSRIRQLSPEHSLENSWMENLWCPKGREEELMYFKKLVLISGLNEHVCAQYPLSAQSLDAAAFKTLVEAPIVLSTLVVPSHEKMHNVLLEQKGTVNRQLLFDFVRETVLSQLWLHSNSHPWIMTGRGNSYSKPSLKVVLKQAWTQILQHNKASFQESNRSLDHFVEKDLKKDQWMQVKDEIADIVDGLETLILCDLLKHATLDMISCKRGFI